MHTPATSSAHISRITVASLILVVFLVSAFLPSPAEARRNGRVKRVIVTYERDDRPEQEYDRTLTRRHGKRLKRWQGEKRHDVVEVSEEQIAVLKQDPLVESVEEDEKISILAQTLPWGVDRIDADKTFTGSGAVLTGTGAIVKVAVIDTGISLSHPDMVVRGGINTINRWVSPNDDHGHGSHVAGTIAAMNNTVGVVGVAPAKTYLYAIKALSASGTGYVSDVVEGLDWAVMNKMHVVNMSIGTSAQSQALQDAIRRAKNAGITLVAGAGNTGGTMLYPAAYPEVIAVGATDATDTVASFSSRGPQLDVVAPGVAVYSTYKGTSYATLSGTSMSGPHVAGVAALLISNPAKCQFLHDATPGCSSDEVQKRIEQTAEQLPSDIIPGRDNTYGWGLVDAERAVMGM